MKYIIEAIKRNVSHAFHGFGDLELTGRDRKKRYPFEVLPVLELETRCKKCGCRDWFQYMRYWDLHHHYTMTNLIINTADAWAKQGNFKEATSVLKKGSKIMKRVR